MVDKLEACPFCGGEAKRFTIGEDEPNNAGGDVIVCTRCQASSHVEFGRKENLVSCWNRRHTPTEDARSRVKVLEEARKSAKALRDAAARSVKSGHRQAHLNLEMMAFALDRIDTALGNKETDRHG